MSEPIFWHPRPFILFSLLWIHHILAYIGVEDHIIHLVDEGPNQNLGNMICFLFLIGKKKGFANSLRIRMEVGQWEKENLKMQSLEFDQIEEKKIQIMAIQAL